MLLQKMRVNCQTILDTFRWVKASDVRYRDIIIKKENLGLMGQKTEAKMNSNVHQINVKPNSTQQNWVYKMQCMGDMFLEEDDVWSKHFHLINHLISKMPCHPEL